MADAPAADASNDANAEDNKNKLKKKKNEPEKKEKLVIHGRKDEDILGSAYVKKYRRDDPTDWSQSGWKSNVAAHLLPRPNQDPPAVGATPARRRSGVDSSPLDGASTATSSPRNDIVHATHGLISTQVEIRGQP